MEINAEPINIFDFDGTLTTETWPKFYLIKMARNKIENNQEEEYMSMKKAIAFTIIGIIAIILGSNLVVENAASLAKAIGISEKMVSLTIIALGTSLPELVTSVTATKKGEYIIKARDLDIEIKNKHKYIKHLIVLEVSIVIIALLQLIVSNNSSLLIFFMLFIIYPVVTILEYNWSLKIINRTIYIKNHSGSHKIQYKDLLLIKVLYRGRGNTEKVLEVEYLKKNKIIKVILPFAGELDSKIYEICKSFITNKEIEKGNQIEYGYFDIRDEFENNFIENKRKRINRAVLLIIQLIFSAIVFVWMLIKLFLILTNL